MPKPGGDRGPTLVGSLSLLTTRLSGPLGVLWTKPDTGVASASPWWSCSLNLYFGFRSHKIGIIVSAYRKFGERGYLGDVSVNSNRGGLFRKHLFSFQNTLAEHKSMENKASNGKRVTENHWCPKSHLTEERRWGRSFSPVELTLAGLNNSEDILCAREVESQESQFTCFKRQCCCSNLWNEMLHINKKWSSSWEWRKLE